MRRILLLAFALLLWLGALSGQELNPKQTDIAMILQNQAGPFVTSEFAQKLGVLVMQQKYPGVIFDFTGVAILDKGDVWWVTFPVKEWPKDIQTLKPALPGHLTVWIRKADAAILRVH